MNKTVMIIGANSVLAQELMPKLGKKYKLITAGRHNCEIYCDVTEPFTIPDNIDVVINFAALYGGNNDDDLLSAIKTNELGLVNICIAANRAKVRYVLNISSIFALLDSNSPHYSVYGVTKRHADELAQLYCDNHQLPLLTLRPSQIYGEHIEHTERQPFLYSIIDHAQKGEDIEIYGHHDPLRNYIHSADIAEIVMRLLGQQVVGVYACSFPRNVTYGEVANTAQKIFGKGGEVRFLSDKPDMNDNVVPVDTSLYDILNYYPQISMKEGIVRIKESRESIL